jgi:beta-N-acetylhexosaminidase
LQALSPTASIKPAVIGIAGHLLTPTEKDLLRRERPAGVILFARNIDTPDQLRALTTALRTELGREAVVMVDQEGGRVARLRPPHWHAHPPAAALGALYASQPAAGLRAAWLTGALIGHECAAMGFNVVCAPVLDLAVPGAHDVIGDRAFAADPDAVAALGAAFANGMLTAGVQPVAKHIPGHGQARVDSHHHLPIMARASDAELAAFRANAGLPWAMTAHILYSDWDPHQPATLSPLIIERIIRGEIGFQGVLVSDDLAMRALHGAPADLANQALQAGCDLVLHCTGVLDESRTLLEACPPISAPAQARLHAAQTRAAEAFTGADPAPLLLERDRLLA